jgi:hypothetical protein
MIFYGFIYGGEGRCEIKVVRLLSSEGGEGKYQITGGMPRGGGGRQVKGYCLPSGKGRCTVYQVAREDVLSTKWQGKVYCLPSGKGMGTVYQVAREGVLSTKWQGKVYCLPSGKGRGFYQVAREGARWGGG